MPNFFIIIIPIVFASAAQILFKKGIVGLGGLDFSSAGIFSLITRIVQNVWLVSGVILFGISFLFYLFALSRFHLNVVYPIFTSSGIILISLASWFFFKETLSWPQILGVVFIIFGIFLLAAKANA